MQSLLTDLIDSLIALPQEIANVALSGPISFVLVVVGSLLFAASFAVFGYLALGAFFDLFIPDTTGRSPPQAGR